MKKKWNDPLSWDEKVLSTAIQAIGLGILVCIMGAVALVIIKVFEE